jgi:predicted deacylase
VQACVHGGEVGGIVGLLTFLDRLQPDQLSGTIVAVMAANPTAVRGYARDTVVDLVNLNRVFPGSPVGSHSEQLAHTLFETCASVADAVIDLHSGGDRSVVPFYSLYWDIDNDASREAGRLARAVGARDVWVSQDHWLAGAMIAHLVQRGTPALIVECGGGSQVMDTDVAAFDGAIRGVAQALGMLPGEAPRPPAYRLLREAEIVYSCRGGLFRPLVGPGEIVAKDQPLGEVVDLHGKIVDVPRSPHGPAWIGAIRRRYMAVYSGDFIAECMTVLAEG